MPRMSRRKQRALESEMFGPAPRSGTAPRPRDQQACDRHIAGKYGLSASAVVETVAQTGRGCWGCGDCCWPVEAWTCPVCSRTYHP